MNEKEREKSWGRMKKIGERNWCMSKMEKKHIHHSNTLYIMGQDTRSFKTFNSYYDIILTFLEILLLVFIINHWPPKYHISKNGS